MKSSPNDTTESFVYEDLVNLARQGDVPAREELLTCLFESIQRIARGYWLAYQWAAPSIDWEDLVQDAYEQMIKLFDLALTKDVPAFYLLGIGRTTIKRVYFAHMPHDEYDNLIPPPLSLDAELYEDMCLYDVIPDQTAPMAEEKDYTVLYQAIEQLPDVRRTTITRHHGIGEQSTELLVDIAHDQQWGKDTTVAYYQQGLHNLYFALSQTETYHHLGQGRMDLLEYRYKSTTFTQSLSEEQCSRLDHAYADLLARGEKMTITRLQQEARVNFYAAATHLQGKPKGSRQQRLDEAYQKIAARGDNVTTRALYQETHIGTPTICAYLQKRRTSEGRQPVDPTNGGKGTNVTINDILQQDFVTC